MREMKTMKHLRAEGGGPERPRPLPIVAKRWRVAASPWWHSMWSGHSVTGASGHGVTGPCFVERLGARSLRVAEFARIQRHRTLNSGEFSYTEHPRAAV